MLKTFLIDVHLQLSTYWKESKNGEVFGYLQCDDERPQVYGAKFANFHPFFKNTQVSKNDIGHLKKHMPRNKE